MPVSQREMCKSQSRVKSQPVCSVQPKTKQPNGRNLKRALEVAFAAAIEVRVVVIVVETDKTCSLSLVADAAVEAPIAKCLSKPFTGGSHASPKASTHRDRVVRGHSVAAEDLWGRVAEQADIHRSPVKRTVGVGGGGGVLNIRA